MHDLSVNECLSWRSSEIWTRGVLEMAHNNCHVTHISISRFVFLEDFRLWEIFFCRNISHSWNFNSVFGCLMSVFLNSILRNGWVTQTIATCLCSWTDTNSCVEPTCWFEDQLIYVCSHDRVLTSSRQTLPHYSAVMKRDMMQSPHMWSKRPQGLAGRMMVVEISDLRNLEEWWLFWPVFWRRLSG